MKGANLNKDNNLTAEHQADEQSKRQSISGKKAINVKLESLKEIEKQQKKQIDQSKEYLEKQAQMLKQKEAELRHQALSLLQNQQSETRRKLEQAYDFAMRSTPWWQRIFWSLGSTMRRAVEIMEQIDSQTLLINIRDMKKAMDAEVPGLTQTENEAPEAGPAPETVDTLERIKAEEEALQKVADKIEEEVMENLKIPKL